MTRVARRLLQWTLLILGVAMVAGCAGKDSPGEAPTLTVDQLVARSADTPIMVEGFLLDRAGVTRLCAAILESYPPQCGEPAVELVGLEVAMLPGVSTARGTTWKEWLRVTVQRRPDARFDVLSVEADE